MKVTLVIAAVCIVASLAGKGDKIDHFVAPIPEKCVKRPKLIKYDGKNYFLSKNVTELADKKFNWYDSRNACREYCMELVSLENEKKNNFIYSLIRPTTQAYDPSRIPSIWTAGRLCDFKGCDSPHLKPKRINGWFWSSSRKQIDPTNKIPDGWSYNPWSQTGFISKPQPDNAEYTINGINESCLTVLSNVYNDGLKWHDEACYHEKLFICEDSQELLDFVVATNPEIRL